MESVGMVLGALEDILNTWTIIGLVVVFIIIVKFARSRTESRDEETTDVDTEPDWEAGDKYSVIPDEELPPARAPNTSPTHRFNQR